MSFSFETDKRGKTRNHLKCWESCDTFLGNVTTGGGKKGNIKDIMLIERYHGRFGNGIGGQQHPIDTKIEETIN